MRFCPLLTATLFLFSCGDDDASIDGGPDRDVGASMADVSLPDTPGFDAGPGVDVGPGFDASAPVDTGPAASGEVALRLIADRGAADAHVIAVPFPRGALRQPSDLRIVEGSSELPLGVSVLAVWPQDGSVRSVLLGFDLSLTRGEERELTLHYGAPRTQDAAEPVFDPAAQSIGILPAGWLSDARVTGAGAPVTADFDAFDNEVTRRLESMSPPYDEYGVSCGGTSRHRTYYDSPHAMWQRYARAPDAERYRRAHEEAAWYRENELEWHDGRAMAVQVCEDDDWTPDEKIDWGVIRRMTGGGMLDDYLLTGDPAAREAVVAMGEAFVRSLPAQMGGRENSLRVTERNLAWTLMGVAAYYALDPSGAQEGLDVLVGEAADWQAAGASGAFEHDIVRPDPEECSDGPAGASPFMTSLLIDGLMDAYLVTDDVRIPPIVVSAAEWFRDDAVTPNGRGFRYLWGCASNGYEDTSSELNNLIVHVFGAAYHVSGDAAWITTGDSFAEAGLDAIYVGRPKQWNQTVRGLSRYLGYRAEAMR